MATVETIMHEATHNLRLTMAFLVGVLSGALVTTEKIQLIGPDEFHVDGNVAFLEKSP